MNRFFTWLYYKIYEAGRKTHVNKELSISDSPRHIIDNEKTMNFSVTRAQGGWVVEYRRYDNKNDRHYTNLHIITLDHDLGEELGKIVTLEALSQ